MAAARRVSTLNFERMLQTWVEVVRVLLRMMVAISESRLARRIQRSTSHSRGQMAPVPFSQSRSLLCCKSPLFSLFLPMPFAPKGRARLVMERGYLCAPYVLDRRCRSQVQRPANRQ
jgi:hypothetical protein